MQKIVDYLLSRYQPETLIVYGSYADGTNGLESDFDAILLSDHAREGHDASVIDGIQLDVFLYPGNAHPDPAELPQLYHSKIVLDTSGKGKRLREEAVRCIESKPKKTKKEILENLDWCEKMLRRTQRGDAEGYFRWHWVLCDSLEFYCHIRGQFYFGPKKTLKWMEQMDPEGFRIYENALNCLEWDPLERWVKYLRGQMEG